MGVSTSRVADLLEQMAWPRPEFAEQFDFSSLQSYLDGVNLEIKLPNHNPQCDITIADRKPRMYPRPGFCQEGYKMHAAMLGPSSACKKQFSEFLPKMSHVFQGPSQRMGPGRDAVPHYFLDPGLHRVVLWELPEINFKQRAEDYIKELGLLYIDCVFLLFSDKYLLTDVYCSLVVAMAIHGIPFFVICTQSRDDITEEEMRKIKTEFQKKDVNGIRIFNPKNPHKFAETLLADFVKEVSYNRGKQSQEGASDGVSEAVLGQTVRLKNLAKKPELNGRCGVCIGYDKSSDRYLARLNLDGVEQDISLKQSSFSVLNPKLVGQVVRVKGLEKKPELNGRFAFVDEFLRDSERYRIFVPDVPGRALVLSLKPENLEKAESNRGAAPIAAAESPAQLSSSASKPSSSLPSRAASGTSPKAASQAPGSRASPVTTPKNSTAGTSDRAAREKPPETSRPVEATNRKNADGNAATSAPADAKQAPAPTSASREAKGKRGEDAEDAFKDMFGTVLPKEEPRKNNDDSDLMSRIFAAERQSDTEETAKKEDSQEPKVEAEKPAPRQRLQLSKQGVLGMKAWAVVGDPDGAEEIIDHLMDCGKTVFGVHAGGETHFTSTADLNTDPSLPNVEVLAFVDPESADVRTAALDAKRIGLQGILFHPEDSMNAYGPGALDICRDAGLTVYCVDLMSEVQPGAGLPVAPLD